MNSVFRTMLDICYRVESVFDRRFLSRDVPTSGSTVDWERKLLNLQDWRGSRVLEVGSREVVQGSTLREDFSGSEYVGFDYYPGRNVDVMGDAHRLSSYFDEGERFDLVYSSACFEHFAMPWIVASEIAKVLNVGGTVFIVTHFSFSSHERPWHFFHFTDMALKALFSEALGFECIEATLSNPIVGRFSSLADRRLRYKQVRGMYCHSQYLGRKVRDVPDFSWDRIGLHDVVGDTKYPEPKAA
ncbi:MAG: methyltransferase domain-containing protein [Fuerstiella sp.]